MEATRESRSWNHNTHYHCLALMAIPSPCGRALEVGCGDGQFARRLAQSCGEVVAIDLDGETLNRAKAKGTVAPNITFIQGDVLTQQLPEGSFDFVVAIAALHHLPLRDGLRRMSDLLAPGGVLYVVGLYRAAALSDYALAALALPVSFVMRLVKGEAKVAAPLSSPLESLAEIRKACDLLLPQGIFRRRLFFRYTFIWQKPLAATSSQPEATRR